ncbi:MAG: diaminopimelate epimerase [Bacteroidetes bacterium]|nr:diaminopimelate epimerase [Bacteroidota bacterium]
MKIPFSKYHGTGNDFIIIDNRLIHWKPTTAEVAFLCDRHTGIGADGLMLLSAMRGFDFAMAYYNSDGNESTMCGNGGRCMTAFANSLGIIGSEAHFWAVDGVHQAEIASNRGTGIYRIQMKDSRIGKIYDDGYFLDTGSPHFVRYVHDAAATDVFNTGTACRHDPRFSPGGTNVDFVEIQDDGLFVRSFERGVENETLSCGTGVTASALVNAFRNPANPGFYHIKTLGGPLMVSFVQDGDQFTGIWLEGAAKFVFTGEISI